MGQFKGLAHIAIRVHYIYPNQGLSIGYVCAVLAIVDKFNAAA